MYEINSSSFCKNSVGFNLPPLSRVLISFQTEQKMWALDTKEKELIRTQPINLKGVNTTWGSIVKKSCLEENSFKWDAVPSKRAAALAWGFCVWNLGLASLPHHILRASGAQGFKKHTYPHIPFFFRSKKKFCHPRLPGSWSSRLFSSVMGSTPTFA